MKLEKYAPYNPKKLFIIIGELEEKIAGSPILWVKRLIRENIEKKRKNRPIEIFIKNFLIPPYLNIFIDCNTFRLRYFEENYETFRY